MRFDACQDASKAAQLATWQHHPVFVVQHLPLSLVVRKSTSNAPIPYGQSEDALLVIECYDMS